MTRYRSRCPLLLAGALALAAVAGPVVSAISSLEGDFISYVERQRAARDGDFTPAGGDRGSSNRVESAPAENEAGGAGWAEAEAEAEAEVAVEAEESCASHPTCAECAQSSWGCHWCARDGACHARGSIHGCAWGASCDDPDDDDDDDNDGDGKNGTSDGSCSSHKTCGECTGSSWDCHWCARDEVCHRKGSVHGCVVGASCDANNDTEKNETACASHDTCQECADSSWGCHWCARDNACHARGSVHGCVVGAGCDAKNDTEKNESACASHDTCQECADSSWGCHWCARDNACHARGSIHGCLVGASCDLKNDTEKNESACASHGTCQECTGSSWGCHWCARDDACHARGSIHGCLVGASCDAKNETGCAKYHTCTECALSSWGCHWCEHDDACHAVGSVYGCATGVNCYSNDRCVRKDPEPIRQFVFAEIGFLPFLGVLAVGLLVCCCASVCFSGAWCVRGLYDDLSVLAGPYCEGEAESVCEPLLGQPGTSGLVQRTPRSALENGDGDNNEREGEDEEEIDNGDGNDEDKEGQAAVNTDGHDYGPLSAADDDADIDDAENNLRTPLIVTSTPRRMRMAYAPPRNIDSVYKGCKICYAITVALTFIFVIVAVVLFPKAPDYCVCNNQMAWKSIVDGITAAKMQASVQLLMSVINPNHLAVVIDMGTGTFKHDNAEVGTFNIPTVTIEAMAITDVMVTCTFTPDKWEALDLVEEYHRGTLKLNVDARVVVMIPALGGYSFQGGIDNYVVDTNDPKLQDRHLCACPTWEDEKKDGGPKAEVTGLLAVADY